MTASWQHERLSVTLPFNLPWVKHPSLNKGTLAQHMKMPERSTKWVDWSTQSKWTWGTAEAMPTIPVSSYSSWASCQWPQRTQWQQWKQSHNSTLPGTVAAVRCREWGKSGVRAPQPWLPGHCSEPCSSSGGTHTTLASQQQQCLWPQATKQQQMCDPMILILRYGSEPGCSSRGGPHASHFPTAEVSVVTRNQATAMVSCSFPSAWDPGDPRCRKCASQPCASGSKPVPTVTPAIARHQGLSEVLTRAPRTPLVEVVEVGSADPQI